MEPRVTATHDEVEATAAVATITAIEEATLAVAQDMEVAIAAVGAKSLVVAAQTGEAVERGTSEMVEGSVGTTAHRAK